MEAWFLFAVFSVIFGLIGVLIAPLPDNMRMKNWFKTEIIGLVLGGILVWILIKFQRSSKCQQWAKALKERFSGAEV